MLQMVDNHNYAKKLNTNDNAFVKAGDEFEIVSMGLVMGLVATALIVMQMLH